MDLQGKAKTITPKKSGTALKDAKGKALTDAVAKGKQSISKAPQSAVVEASPNADNKPKDYSPTQTQTQTPKTVQTTGTPPEGYVPVRETLNKYGVEDARIGWNNGRVTIDGHDMIEPTVNIDGTTYVSPQEIYDLTNKAFALKGTPLVAVSDYFAGKGVADAVKWDDASKTATYGGHIIPYKYNADGTVYAAQQDLDDIYNQSMESNELASNRQPIEARDKKYGSMEEEALRDILDYDEYKFNIEESDTGYDYKKALEDAYRSILNANNASEGSSSAVTAMGIAAMNEAFREAYFDIYDRDKEAYDDKYDREVKDLDIINELANEVYDREHTAGRDQREDTNYANEQEAKREQQEFDNDITTKETNSKLESAAKNNITTDLTNEGLVLTNEGLVLSNDRTRIDNEQALKTNAMNEAQTRGFWVQSDETFFPWLVDYRIVDESGKITGYSIDPWAGAEAYEKDIAQVGYNAKLGKF